MYTTFLEILFFLIECAYYDALIINNVLPFYCVQFFTTKPYACDPSSLPQYPPSKEMDAKLRDEESKR